MFPAPTLKIKISATQMKSKTHSNIFKWCIKIENLEISEIKLMKLRVFGATQMDKAGLHNIVSKNNMLDGVITINTNSYVELYYTANTYDLRPKKCELNCQVLACDSVLEEHDFNMNIFDGALKFYEN